MALRGQLTNPDGYSRSAAIVADTPFAASDALVVLANGNATVTLLDGSTLALVGLTAGQIVPLRATEVAGGATATLAALYW